MTKPAAAATAVLVALSVATACRAQSPADTAELEAMDSTDQHATHAAHEAMSGPMSVDPHLTLTPLRPRSPADSRLRPRRRAPRGEDGSCPAYPDGWRT